MAAPRPETIIMREARQAAKEDGLRVTIEIGQGGVTKITMEPVASNREGEPSLPGKDAKPQQPGRWQ